MESTRGAVQRESALDADAVGSAANGERFADRAVAAGNNHAFERLQTLASAFDNLHFDANGIADVQTREYRNCS